MEVKEKISEMVQDSDEGAENYTDHKMFKREHDEQLLLWLNQWVCFANLNPYCLREKKASSAYLF